MPNENDEIRQCHVCRCGSKTASGNVRFYFNEISVNKDTGKGSKVPRYICDRDRASTDRSIKQTIRQALGMPTATRMSLLGMVTA